VDGRMRGSRCMMRGSKERDEKEEMEG